MASPLPSSSTFPNMILFLPYLFFGLRLNNKIDEAFRTKGLDFQTDVARRRQKKVHHKIFDRSTTCIVLLIKFNAQKHICAKNQEFLFQKLIFFLKNQRWGEPAVISSVEIVQFSALVHWSLIRCP